MRGFGILAVLISLFIVIYLTVISAKKPTSSATIEKATGMEMPANLTDLPAKAREKLNEATKNAEERNKKAAEGLE